MSARCFTAFALQNGVLALKVRFLLCSGDNSRVPLKVRLLRVIESRRGVRLEGTLCWISELRRNQRGVLIMLIAFSVCMDLDIIVLLHARVLNQARTACAYLSTYLHAHTHTHAHARTHARTHIQRTEMAAVPCGT